MWRRRLEDVGGSQAAATVESAFCSPSPFASGFYARPPPKRPPPPEPEFSADRYIYLSENPAIHRNEDDFVAWHPGKLGRRLG